MYVLGGLQQEGKGGSIKEGPHESHGTEMREEGHPIVGQHKPGSLQTIMPPGIRLLVRPHGDSRSGVAGGLGAGVAAGRGGTCKTCGPRAGSTARRRGPRAESAAGKRGSRAVSACSEGQGRGKGWGPGPRAAGGQASRQAGTPPTRTPSAPAHSQLTRAGRCRWTPAPRLGRWQNRTLPPPPAPGWRWRRSGRG